MAAGAAEAITIKRGDTPIARVLKSGERTYRGKMVRLLSQNNEQLGICPFEEAMSRAASAGLDLVEMNAKAEPPVCRILDYGKFQYQEDKRLKNAKKNQIQQKVKEIKFHPGIDANDFSVKVKHAIEFLQKGDKVRVIIAFRGRELSHPELGQQVIDRLIAVVGEQAIIDAPAKMLGKNCQMMLAPNPKLKKKADAPKAGEVATEA